MSAPIGKQSPPVIPTKDQIKQLPPFTTLALERITLVSKAEVAEQTCSELASADFCGFDTESKTLFKKGQISDGPHLIQLATLDKAWVIQLHDLECRTIILQWICRSNVIKAGFGLHHDRKQIERQFGVKPAGIVELNAELRKRRGFSRDIGTECAVAVLFEQRFVKTKTRMSDWSVRQLSPKQLLYAANDAYVAAIVYNALVRTNADVGGFSNR